ncbi:MAG: hypothetical protein ACXV2C_00040 [Candidatus Bathyarchaeia archaeon]
MSDVGPIVTETVQGAPVFEFGDPSFYARTATLLTSSGFLSRTIFYSAFGFSWMANGSDEVNAYGLATTRTEEWIFEDNGQRTIYVARTPGKITRLQEEITDLGFSITSSPQVKNITCFNNDILTTCTKTQVGVKNTMWTGLGACPDGCSPMCCGTADCGSPVGCCGDSEDRCIAPSSWLRTTTFSSSGEKHLTTINITKAVEYLFASSIEQNINTGQFLTIHSIKNLPRPDLSFFDLPIACLSVGTLVREEAPPSMFPLSHVYNCEKDQCKF